MRTAAALVMLLWLVVLGPTACGGGVKGLVKGYGVYEVDQDMELRVTARGLSLVDYELRDTSLRRTLVRYQIGRSDSRWFLFWDPSGRLWAYSIDAELAVWVPSRSGQYERHAVSPGSPFLQTMPAPVAESLPRSARRSLGLASAEEGSR